MVPEQTETDSNSNYAFSEIAGISSQLPFAFRLKDASLADELLSEFPSSVLEQLVRASNLIPVVLTGLDRIFV